MAMASTWAYAPTAPTEGGEAASGASILARLDSRSSSATGPLLRGSSGREAVEQGKERETSELVMGDMLRKQRKAKSVAAPHTCLTTTFNATT